MLLWNGSDTGRLPKLDAIAAFVKCIHYQRKPVLHLLGGLEALEQLADLALEWQRYRQTARN